MPFASIRRASQIANVLFKQGFGYAVQEMDLQWHVSLPKRLFYRKTPTEPLPVRLRMAMEELGGAFVKLGQLLSLRPDLVPPEYASEFRKLQDKVAPIPFDTVKKLLESELKQPVSKAFLHVEPQPIGSASVSQAHKATLRDGKPVVIKVQRPEAEAQFKGDIALMRLLAERLEKSRYGQFKPAAIVDEFEKYTRNELNFVYEARNIDRFAAIFKGKTVRVPHVLWPLCSKRVLTMTYLDGSKLSEIDGVAIDKKIVSSRVADAMVTQLFEQGFFHADLHPGNILVWKDNSIGLLDFGITGSLSSTIRRQGILLYTALLEKDADRAYRILTSVGTPREDAKLDALRENVASIINEWYGSDLGQARVTQMMHQLFVSAVQHGVNMPVDLLLVGKALVTAEATCLLLDPKFSFSEYSKPTIRRLMRQDAKRRLAPKYWYTKSLAAGQFAEDFALETLGVMEKLQRGAVKLEMKDVDVRHIGLDIGRSSNRISFALLIASLIIGGAMLIDFGPKISGYSVVTLVLLSVAIILLLSFLVSMYREGSPGFDSHMETAR
ncbi:hypothetical protein HY642_03735 [Candidatus Woesearchaeota archaeon]|nr:hypothetical protein [Candidatus Woesearchaeota archaeon]